MGVTGLSEYVSIAAREAISNRVVAVNEVRGCDRDKYRVHEK
jgi:hypothetical protein